MQLKSFKPRDAKDVEAAVQWALAESKTLEIVGMAPSAASAAPAQWDLSLDLSDLSGVTLYEPEELVLSARAGTPIAEIEALLPKNNQELAFEPMDYGAGVRRARRARHDRRRARRESLRPAPHQGGRGARSFPRRSRRCRAAARPSSRAGAW